MTALGIAAVGAMTAVGEDAPATVGSIFTEAEAFKRLAVAGRESLAGALTPIAGDVKGTDRLAALGAFVLKEATQEMVPGTEIGLVVCTSSDGIKDEPDGETRFLARLASDACVLVDKRASRVFFGGATATVDALSFARKALGSPDLAAVCVLGVDSLSTQPRLGKLLREKSSQAERFVPGEAAAALLLTRRLGSDSLAILAGIGASPSYTDEKPSNPAKNSISAIERAMSDAELSRAPIAALVHDLPATQAGDEELTWLYSGSILATPGFSVLAPSSSAGETGAASGILSLVTLAFLFRKAEISGPGVCLFAAANVQRGAALLMSPSKRKPART
jgi:hypothetical protein